MICTELTLGLNTALSILESLAKANTTHQTGNMVDHMLCICFLNYYKGYSNKNLHLFSSKDVNKVYYYSPEYEYRIEQFYTTWSLHLLHDYYMRARDSVNKAAILYILIWQQVLLDIGVTSE